jgi:hypothetical protein
VENHLNIFLKNYGRWDSGKTKSACLFLLSFRFEYYEAEFDFEDSYPYSFNLYRYFPLGLSLLILITGEKDFFFGGFANLWEWFNLNFPPYLLILQVRSIIHLPSRKWISVLEVESWLKIIAIYYQRKKCGFLLQSCPTFLSGQLMEIAMALSQLTFSVHGVLSSRILQCALQLTWR